MIHCRQCRQRPPCSEGGFAGVAGEFTPLTSRVNQSAPCRVPPLLQHRGAGGVDAGENFPQAPAAAGVLGRPAGRVPSYFCGQPDAVTSQKLHSP